LGLRIVSLACFGRLNQCVSDCMHRFSLRLFSVFSLSFNWRFLLRQCSLLAADWLVTTLEIKSWRICGTCSTTQKLEDYVCLETFLNPICSLSNRKKPHRTLSAYVPIAHRERLYNSQSCAGSTLSSLESTLLTKDPPVLWSH
jgi:hypothetical protein